MGWILLLQALLLFQVKAPATAEEIVQEWVTRWTQLDGSDQSAARFAELYLPDGVHETGPSPRQYGLVHFEGHADIRHMAKTFGEANTEVTFRVPLVTANEKDAATFYMSQGPWGGPAVAIEYVSAYTVKKDKKRYMSSGAAFFQIQAGKIRRVRMYAPQQEIMEVLNR
jgi:ketosteroid isomerase-like protein